MIDKNLTGIEYKLAKCCNPIYGDEVFGFVSTQGIKIHRMDCPNAQEMFSRFGYRIIQAKWSGKGDNGYIVTLRVIGRETSRSSPTSPPSSARKRASHSAP